MAKRKKSVALTESEWAEVFRLRCRAKRGEYLSPEHIEMFRRAIAADGKRYAAMSAEVFEATKPFGAR